METRELFAPLLHVSAADELIVSDIIQSLHAWYVSSDGDVMWRDSGSSCKELKSGPRNVDPGNPHKICMQGKKILNKCSGKSTFTIENSHNLQ